MKLKIKILSGLATLAFATGAFAQTAIDLAPFNISFTTSGNARTLTAKPKIAIAGYNVASYIEQKVTAYSGGMLSGGSGARATMKFTQNGITPELLTEIATAGYQDLLAQLQAAGFEVVTLEQVKAHPNSGSGSIGTYDKQTSFLGNDLINRGPAGIGGTGYLAIGAGFHNANGFAKISSENDAVLVFNNLVFNFVNAQSSGNSHLARNASVGGTPKFILENNITNTQFVFSRDGRYADGWFTLVGQRLVSDEPFANMQTTRNTDNGAAAAISAAFGVGMANTSRRDNTINVDPVKYKELALRAVHGYNLSVVQRIKDARGMR